MTIEIWRNDNEHMNDLDMRQFDSRHNHTYFFFFWPRPSYYYLEIFTPLIEGFQIFFNFPKRKLILSIDFSKDIDFR